MTLLNLNHANRDALRAQIDQQKWIVACLCAQWCDVCGSYRKVFEELAQRHPELQLVWIDIEDQADLVGDFDVENFPTLLIQRGDRVRFFGTVVPDSRVTQRLIQAQIEAADSLVVLTENSEQQRWQQEFNLNRCLG